MKAPAKVLVFDLDGTLIDSDDALIAPFLELGIDRNDITFGHAVAEECQRLGISLDDYVDAYDVHIVQPFDGVAEVLTEIPRWSVFSNKHPRSGRAELDRLGWQPELVMFSDEFDWAHKRLGPVLERLQLTANDVVMIGDSLGDFNCAVEVGCDFAWAGWNPRVLSEQPEGLILEQPADLLGLL